MAKQIKKNKTEQKIKKRVEAYLSLTCASPVLAQPTLPVHLAAQPTRGTAVFNLCLLAEACRRAVAGPPPPASPWQPPRPPRDATKTAPTPSHFSLALWTPPPPLLSLPLVTERT